MNAKEYFDLLTLDQGSRPDWTNEAAYADNELWSYKRWAWHFLQRNPNYQAVSVKTGPSSQKRANQFGRASLKPYRQKYAAAEDEIKSWLPELVSNVDSCMVGKGTAVTYELEFGEVAIVIDLSRSVLAGRAAVTAMMIDARRRVDEELVKFERALKKSGGKPPEILKPRRDKLLDRLRMCDALWKRASDDELIAVFYANYFRNGVGPVGDERKQIVRKIRDEQKAALRMMEGGYLELIPLYYIQDKSSKKMGVPP